MEAKRRQWALFEWSIVGREDKEDRPAALGRVSLVSGLFGGDVCGGHGESEFEQWIVQGLWWCVVVTP